MTARSDYAFGHGGALLNPPSDAKTQSLIRKFFPVDPYWRFGALLTADRCARAMRDENQRRQAAWFGRAGHLAT